MRPDLAKCVIEAPRRGSRFAKSAKAKDYGSFRFTGKRQHGPDDVDYGPNRLPVSHKQEGYNKKLGSKDFADKLGPLHNYLRSNCGRRWDDVYAEIAYNIGRFTKAEGLRHIISAHLDVATNTWRGESGKVYNDGKRGVETVGTYYGWRSDFYVEPETGLLREAPRYKRPERPADPVKLIQLEDGRYEQIAGIWYYIRMVKVDTKDFAGTDINGMPIYRYSTEWREASKKQLNKRELVGLRKLL